MSNSNRKLITIPLWLFMLVCLFILLVILGLVLGIIFKGHNQNNNKEDSDLGTKCKNFGKFSYITKKCTCYESTTGDFCEKCNFLCLIYIFKKVMEFEKKIVFFSG